MGVVQEGEVVQQAAFVGAPIAAAPARINVSPELFAKLAAGGQLTPEEMAQLSGEPTPVEQQPASPEKQPGTQLTGAEAGTEAADKKDKSGAKDPLKASKKKNKSCC